MINIDICQNNTKNMKSLYKNNNYINNIKFFEKEKYNKIGYIFINKLIKNITFLNSNINILFNIIDNISNNNVLDNNTFDNNLLLYEYIVTNNNLNIKNNMVIINLLLKYKFITNKLFITNMYTIYMIKYNLIMVIISLIKKNNTIKSNKITITILKIYLELLKLNKINNIFEIDIKSINLIYKNIK